MASGTHGGRVSHSGKRGVSGSNWTGDDILRDAAEAFSLLPRPASAAREAFLTLLSGYWPTASEGTRHAVAAMLRASPRVGTAVLDALDRLTDSRGAADPNADLDASEDDAALPALPTMIARRVTVSHRDGLKVAATVMGRVAAALPVEDASGDRDAGGKRTARRVVIAPPPLDAWTDGSATPAQDPVSSKRDPMDGSGSAIGSGRRAGHARRVVRRLASEESNATPTLQPNRIERVLREAARPAAAIADLLDVVPARANAVVALPRARGTAVALRALGVDIALAEELVARWRGRAPMGFAESYAALDVEECLATVARWRREDAGIAADNDASADDGAPELRRKA